VPAGGFIVGGSPHFVIVSVCEPNGCDMTSI